MLETRVLRLHATSRSMVICFQTASPAYKKKRCIGEENLHWTSKKTKVPVLIQCLCLAEPEIQCCTSPDPLYRKPAVTDLVFGEIVWQAMCGGMHVLCAARPLHVYACKGIEKADRVQN